MPVVDEITFTAWPKRMTSESFLRLENLRGSRSPKDMGTEKWLGKFQNKGRFYLLTDIWVTHKEEHKRARRLTLRKMFLHFNSFLYRRPFDVYRSDHHIASNYLCSLYTPPVLFLAEFSPMKNRNSPKLEAKAIWKSYLWKVIRWSYDIWDFLKTVLALKKKKVWCYW